MSNKIKISDGFHFRDGRIISETDVETITCEKDMGAGDFSYTFLNLYKNNESIGYYALNTNRMMLDFDSYQELTVGEECAIEDAIKKFKEEMSNGIQSSNSGKGI